MNEVNFNVFNEVSVLEKNDPKEEEKSLQELLDENDKFVKENYGDDVIEMIEENDYEDILRNLSFYSK